MQVVKLVLWALLLVLLVAFSVANWTTTMAGDQISVTIWDGIVWDTRLPAVVVIAFALGLIPMWLIHRGEKWRLKRRINALESAQRANSLNYAREHTETIRDRDGDGIPDSVDPQPDTHADTGEHTPPSPPRTEPI
ncbi:LapA family protein [Pseudoblastomonas halimionae]|uniref:DUF1049 domain-containing protein n=1 Tax=Alteriqipengyuania halimionae TaxID=1926630 RepID=A0A6I4U4C6_9SPHN|nr:LapA family protein [Alteriqipengyuania halimionae]MXP09775.1 DUF1049 domain-containing protein [Alteriqipengyuania halimionae]